MQSAAASNLKDVTMELGGKSPLVVFEDADIMLQWRRWQCVYTQGEICATAPCLRSTFCLSSLY